MHSVSSLLEATLPGVGEIVRGDCPGVNVLPSFLGPRFVGGEYTPDFGHAFPNRTYF